MSEIETILMERDGMTAAEAASTLADARSEVSDGGDPEEILFGLGLEPDYIFDLLD
jgi:hypothetical protein